jgi:hypothetical protein
MFGCIAHCFDLLCEDLVKIPEFDNLVKQAKMIVRFVKGRKYVLSYLKKLIGNMGRSLVLFPDTRFACADLMVGRVLHNKTHLKEMVDNSARWSKSKKGIDDNLCRVFEEAVVDDNFMYKLQLMHNVLRPITSATHHIESCGARASWVLPLCMACWKAINEWSTDKAVQREFLEATRKKVVDKFKAGWLGSGNLQVGLKKDAHILAFFLDPFTTPTLGEARQLPGWEESCRTALLQFYKDCELNKAMSKLNNVLLRVGNWGETIKQKQALLVVSEEEEASFKNDVDRIIFMQKRMAKLEVVSCWQVNGASQHPHLAPVAVKLAVVAVQSADVERVCKAHKVIHTKSRNRLLTTTVHMLLFTYVNLRLLRKCTQEIGDFLTQCLEG